MKKISTLGGFLVGCLLVLLLTMPSLIRLHNIESGASTAAQQQEQKPAVAGASAETPLVPADYAPAGTARISYDVSQAKPLKNGARITIGMLQMMDHPALDDIRYGIIDELGKRGYVNGVNIEIDYKNGQNDQNSMKSIADQFMAEKKDLLIGIATPAAQALMNAAGGSTPVIYAGISDPVGAGLAESLEKPGKPVTGATYASQDRETIALIKAISPAARTLGILYNTSEQNAAQQVATVRPIAEAAGYAVKERTITSTNDLAQVAEQLAGEVDAIYVPEDNTIASAMSTLIPATNAHGVPVYTVADSMVAQGAIATSGLNQYLWGADSGDVLADVIEGADPAAYPVKVSTKSNAFINSDAARALQITLPAAVTKDAIDMAPSQQKETD